jgi:hypothetical protein
MQTLYALHSTANSDKHSCAPAARAARAALTARLVRERHARGAARAALVPRRARATARAGLKRTVAAAKRHAAMLRAATISMAVAAPVHAPALPAAAPPGAAAAAFAAPQEPAQLAADIEEEDAPWTESDIETEVDSLNDSWDGAGQVPLALALFSGVDGEEGGEGGANDCATDNDTVIDDASLDAF